MTNVLNFQETMRYITLIVTQNCNLCCSYCYEHNKTENTFDVKLAKEIITAEANTDDGYSELCVDFFGGEPFLEFEKIKEIVEFCKTQTFKKQLYFFAGTNGTTITPQIQEWLVKNRDIFQIALSLDGTKAMHDKNRSNSYDLIDIDFFVNKFRNISVKATISPDTVYTLAEGVIHLHSLGFKNVSCNLAVGVDWSNPIYCTVLQRELNKLIEFYLKNPQIQPCGLLNYRIPYVAHPNNGKAIKFCGAGTRTKVYDTDGRVYPCQYFLPMTIGDKKTDSEPVKFCDQMDLSDLDTKCQDCVAVNICPSCYGSNYQEHGNIHTRANDFCNLQKIIILANSYFKAKQWELGLLNLDEYAEQELLHGIMIIQENIHPTGI